MLAVAVTVLIGLVVTWAWRALLARLSELARLPRSLDELRSELGGVRTTVQDALHEWREHHTDHERRLLRLENGENRP